MCNKYLYRRFCEHTHIDRRAALSIWRNSCSNQWGQTVLGLVGLANNWLRCMLMTSTHLVYELWLRIVFLLLFMDETAAAACYGRAIKKQRYMCVDMMDGHTRRHVRYSEQQNQQKKSIYMNRKEMKEKRRAFAKNSATWRSQFTSHGHTHHTHTHTHEKRAENASLQWLKLQLAGAHSLYFLSLSVSPAPFVSCCFAV